MNLLKKHYMNEKKKKSKIYIKLVRPEMTQCRIIQLDKRRKK